MTREKKRIVLSDRNPAAVAQKNEISAVLNQLIETEKFRTTLTTWTRTFLVREKTLDAQETIEASKVRSGKAAQSLKGQISVS